MSSSQPSRHSGVASSTISTPAGSGRSAASAASTRTPRPLRSRPRTTSSALRTAAGLPVCASRNTVRSRAPSFDPFVPGLFSRLNGAPPPLRGRRPPGSSAGAPARSHRKYSTLPEGPGSGLAVTPRTPSPSSAACAGHGPHGLGAQLGAAYHAAAAQPLLADLELRLDHQYQVGVGAGAAHQRGQHQAERDEGQVARRPGPPAARRSSSSVSSRTFVRSLTVTRSSLCKRPGELSVADVDGDHLGGAGPQQHVGEAAGGGARVERPAALDLRPSGSKAASAPASLWPPRET